MKVLNQTNFDRMVVRREERAKMKTRLSLSEIDERARMAFDENTLDTFSQMLEECSEKGVKISVLTDWIVFLKDLKRERLGDDMAKEVLDFYIVKLKTRRHWIVVNSSSGFSVNVLPKRPLKLIDYDWARKRLGRIAKEKAFEKKGIRFTLDTKAEAMQWQLMLRWFIFDDKSVLDVEKSVYIHGLTGRGKTFVFECLQELGKQIINMGACPANEAHFYEWDYVDLNVLHEKCSGLSKESDKPSLAPSKKLKFGNWCMDELCNEDRVLKVYTKEYRFFERILTERERCKSSSKRAIFIGNNTVRDMHCYYANDVNYDYESDESRFSSRWRGMVGDNELLWVGEYDRR